MKKSQDNKLQFNSRISMLCFFMKDSFVFFIPTAIFACLVSLFELINPRIIGYVVDIIIDDTSNIPARIMDILNDLGGREYVLKHLYLVALAIVLIALVGALFRYLFRFFDVAGAERLVRRMRDNLYDRIIHLPFSWHDKNKTGDIIQRCTSDVDMIRNFLSEQLANLFQIVVMIVIAAYFMLSIHVTLSCIALAFIPIVILYSLLFHNKIGSSFEKVDNEEGRVSAVVQENLTGVRVVRAFGKEAYERERFEKRNEEYTGMWVYMMKVLATFWTVNDIISGIQSVLIMALGCYFTVNNQMSAGDYVAFCTLNGLLVWPVRQLGRTISEMSKTGISIDRLMYIMNSEPENDKENAIDFPSEYDICFENVTFGYNDKVILKEVNFDIPKGTTVGILGGTGSGKTTLLYLLENLYELPEGSGSIYIGGNDIRSIRKSELRKNLGIVLQEPYLFSGSIEENIKLSSQDASHEDVCEASALASLDTALNKFKDGYNTFVGERGVTLSGGQKQRTAIAQMLIRKPPIMIFDDSMSAVDTQTDLKIRKGIKEAAKSSTVIIVSHRITTLMQADTIVVMDKGKVKEIGNHEKLISQEGIYKKIYDLQCGIKEEYDE